MVILTVDLGTTVTKADLWDAIAGWLGTAGPSWSPPVPRPDRAEQDPADVVAGSASRPVAAARQTAPEAWADAAAIGFAGRPPDDLVLVRRRRHPTGPALLVVGPPGRRRGRGP